MACGIIDRKENGWEDHKNHVCYSCKNTKIKRESKRWASTCGECLFATDYHVPTVCHWEKGRAK
jgi:hypothetical protein